MQPPSNGRQGPRAPLAPASAPPRIGDTSVFSGHQERQILPFQAQYAAQLERHIHTGPIIGPIRSKRQRPSIQVIIEDTEPTHRTDTKPASIIGSDIIRMTPGTESASTRTESQRKEWSPDSNPTSSDGITPLSRTPSTIRMSTARDSNLSFLNMGGSNLRRTFSTSTSRQPSTRRKVRSPGEGSLKLPWRTAPRTSVASGRTFGGGGGGGGGGREELPVLMEGQLDSSGHSQRFSRATTSRSSTATKRMVISRPHSLRPSRQASLADHRLSAQRPGLSLSRPSSSQLLTIPTTPRSPRPPPSPPASRSAVTPQPIPATPPSGSYERAQGSGRLRGPRSPPMPSATSTPNLRSGWPSAEETREEHRRHQRRRSGSCPELPPLDLTPHSLRRDVSVRR